MSLKYHEHQLNFPLYDLKTVRFTKNSRLTQQPLFIHVPQERCTLLLMQNHFIHTKVQIHQQQIHHGQVPVSPFWRLRQRSHHQRGSSCYKLN